MFSALVSVVVLAIASILLIALLYRDPITRQKRAVEELGLPEAKAELIRKFQAGNNFIISRLEKLLAAIKAAFGGKEPEIDYDLHHKARMLFRLVWVGITLDWLIQWMVNQRMPILSPLGWVIPSLLMALLIAWFTELSAFALTDDPARPARGERICRDGMFVTGIVSVSCLLLFLYGRTVSSASVTDWLIAIISASLWFVAEGLGISCGFAAAWARHIDRAGRASKKFHQIERELQPRYEFREWLEEQDARSKIKIASTVLLLILALFSTNSGLAQSPSPILIDGTASVDPARLSDALARLRESAPMLARTYTRVKVGIFSDEGPFTKIGTAVSIPSLASVRDCSGAIAAAKSFRQDLTVMFPGIREYQDGRNTRQCLAGNLSVERKNRENLAAVVGKIHSAIPESVDPKPACTAIAGLLQFLLSSPQSSGSTFLLITDGEESCNRNTISGIQIPAGSKVILFLVPKRGPIEKEGPEALKRGETWQASIPGLVVHPYTGILEMIGKLP
jgi:hypothetical protein